MEDREKEITRLGYGTNPPVSPARTPGGEATGSYDVEVAGVVWWVDSGSLEGGDDGEPP